MKLSEVSAQELQLLRLSYKIADLCLLFQATKSEVYGTCKRLEVLTPPEYVKSMPPIVLAGMIAAQGHEKVASHFLVSVSFLKNLFAGEANSGLGNTWTESELHALLTKFKSKTIVQRMTGVKKSRLDSFTDIEYDLSQTGDMTGGIGRRAENFVLEHIGGEDMNAVDPRSLYDIEHQDYGRINVKSTNKTPWRAPKTENCDWVALVGRKKDVFKFIILVPATMLPLTIKNPARPPVGCKIIINQGLSL